MAEDTSSRSQNTELRDKFISVVEPVFAGGDEGNILTLLTSLANVCQRDERLLVTPLNVESSKGTSTIEGTTARRDKATEFTCWLLAELITANGSKVVCEANINLQVTIMRLLATRNPVLFARILEEYLQIGLEGKEVLFDGGTVSCQCFSSVVDKANAHPTPRTIEFADNTHLDHILTNIVTVIGHLGDDLFLMGAQHDQMWLLAICCLEAGDNSLKASSLFTIARLLDTCGLPVDLERVDYLLQCVAATVHFLAEMSVDLCTTADANTKTVDTTGSATELASKSKEISLKNHLSAVLSSLQKHIPQLPSVVRDDLLVTLIKAVSPPHRLKKLPCVIAAVTVKEVSSPEDPDAVAGLRLADPVVLCISLVGGVSQPLYLEGKLRRPILQCFCALVDCIGSSSHFSEASSALQECVKNNLLMPQVGSVLLIRLVKEEVVAALPASSETSQSRTQTRKRKLSETEQMTPTVKVMNLSKWWKDALEQLSRVFMEWSERGGTEMEMEVEAATEVLALAERVAVVATPCSQVSLQFLPESWLIAATDFLLSVITSTKETGIVLKLLDLFWWLIWIWSVIDPSNEESQLGHTWLALVTLPWIATEVNLMDLKPPNVRQFTQWAAKLKWNENHITDIKIPPVVFRFRCGSQIEKYESTCCTTWECGSPVAMSCGALGHQREGYSNYAADSHVVSFTGASDGRCWGQQLVGEVVGAVINFPDKETVHAAAHSLRRLLCALLHLTTIKFDSCEDQPPYALCCKICDDSCISRLDTQRVDPTLVAQYLDLLNSSAVDVVIEVVEALPAVVAHSAINSQTISRYLSLLTHSDKKVVSAVARNVPSIFCPGSLSLPSQDSKNLLVSKEGESVLSHLSDIVKACDASNPAASKPVLSVLEVLHHLVKVPLQGLTGCVLVLLVRCLLVRESTVSASAHLTIHALADALSLTPRELYTRHRHSIAQVLSEIINPGEVAPLLSHVAEVFQWPTFISGAKRNGQNSQLRSFANSQLQHLLPALATRASHQANPSLLQDLAFSCGLRLRDILIDHFQHILAQLVFYHTKKEQENVLKFIAATTDIHIQNIRRCSVQNQVNELVMGLHEHRSGVLQEFSHMKTLEPGWNEQGGGQRHDGAEGIGSSEDGMDELRDIADYLAPRLLGILGFLDNKLVSSSTMYNLDESTLEGLIEEVVVVIRPLVVKRPEQLVKVLTHVLS